MVKWIFFRFFFEFLRKFWLGGAAPQTPQFLAGGAKPPQNPPKRSSAAFDRGGQTGPPRSNAFWGESFGSPWHVSEAAKRGRLDQMIFFGAVDDTGAADDTGATDECPPAVRQPSTVPMLTVPSFSA